MAAQRTATPRAATMACLTSVWGCSSYIMFLSATTPVTETACTERLWCGIMRTDGASMPRRSAATPPCWSTCCRAKQNMVASSGTAETCTPSSAGNATIASISALACAASAAMSFDSGAERRENSSPPAVGRRGRTRAARATIAAGLSWPTPRCPRASAAAGRMCAYGRRASTPSPGGRASSSASLRTANTGSSGSCHSGGVSHTRSSTARAARSFAGTLGDPHRPRR
eukprot:scaffold50948_cov74-Phaeocystis_antarctica.AAC.4